MPMMFAPLVTGVRSCSTRLTSKRMSKRELHLVMMGVAFLTKEGVHNARDLPTVLFFPPAHPGFGYVLESCPTTWYMVVRLDLVEPH